jgi:hypothetical protein
VETGITINWVDETHRCVHVIYGRNWTWEEFFSTDETARAMLDSIAYKSDFILDLQHAITPPNIVAQFPKFVRGAASLTHANSRYVMLVGSNPHYRVLLDVFRKVYPSMGKRVFQVATLDEARALIAERPHADHGSTSVAS